MARQRLGQHFLADAGWREEIARAIRVSAQSIAPSPGGNRGEFCWIEIGAGHGEMTEQLASTGAPVHAIELDAQLAATLKRLTERFPNVEIVSADILESDIGKIAAGKRVRIYGNLPYYITSPILHHLFASVELIDEINIVIQHEVALRLAAQPGTRDYGYLSVLTQYFSRPELVLEIPRVDETGFLDFVKLCFSQKRKTLVNNLKSRVKPQLVREALTNLKLRADVRAEQLSVANLAALLQELEGRPR